MLKRPFKKTVKYSAEDLEIKEFLIGLAKEQYDHGDSFYAIKKLSGSWEFGSSNDEPMKFGNGYTNQLAGNMVKLLFVIKRLRTYIYLDQQIHLENILYT